MNQAFPFGQPLRCVQQTDRTPKRVFVLGVYASAVHARWVGPDQQELIKALPVASEPLPFWTGEGAADLIQQITCPSELGKLEAAEGSYNGATGLALDSRILVPLGLTRGDAWLCNLVAHACLNTSQKKAIAQHYAPLAQQHGLPPASIPDVPEEEVASAARRSEIVAELRASQAQTLIVLGDQPIRWFLNKVGQPWKRLSEMKPYGRLHPIKLAGMRLDVLPLVHARQAAGLGLSSQEWFQQHEQWVKSAPRLAWLEQRRRLTP